MRPGAAKPFPDKLGAATNDGYSGDRLFVTRKITSGAAVTATLRVSFSTHDMHQRKARFVQIVERVRSSRKFCAIRRHVARVPLLAHTDIARRRRDSSAKFARDHPFVRARA